MLIIAMNVWYGKRSTIEQIEGTLHYERQVAFATRIKLEDAIEKIANYQKVFNTHYSKAIELCLLHVSEIDNLSNKQIDLAGLELVENLSQTPEDFENN